MDNRTIDRIELDRELVARHGLRKFLPLAWPQIRSEQYVGNWHIDLVCERLGALFDRQIRKLIINQPPGTCKTLTASVFYPSWCWSIDPTESFIYASFDQGLMNQAARDMRDLVASEWYQQRWPKARLPQSAVRQVQLYKNSAGGWRFSTSVGGKGTGWHPNQRVIDDPTKPKDTQGDGDTTRRALEKTELWYNGTISTRQSDPKTTIDLLIMQRLHDADLSGKLRAKWGDEVEVLMLPMRYEPARCYSFSYVVDRP